MAPQPAESPRNASSRCQGSGPHVSLCRRDVRPLDSASPPCCRRRPWRPDGPARTPRPPRPRGAPVRSPPHRGSRATDATCAGRRWGEASLVRSARASIRPSLLRPRDAAPRLHYAFSGRTVCGRDPCLYAVPRPPTGTPRLLFPWGGAPLPDERPAGAGQAGPEAGRYAARREHRPLRRADNPRGHLPQRRVGVRQPGGTGLSGA